MLRRWSATGGPKVTFQHVDHIHNTWADWLARVAAHVKRSFSLEDFADVWPTCDAAPKEVGVGIWKGPDYVQGQLLGGELARALAAIPAMKQRLVLKAWVNARSRGLQVGQLECPKC